ncbi:hypothetical protein ACXYMT_13155 [Salinimicrobium sp. CAU 1759]
MKLINFLEFPRLNKVREEMGAPIIPYSGPKTWIDLDDNRLKELLEIGEVQLDPEDIEIKDGTFEYKGKKVIVYIRDQYAKYYERGYRFHLTNCSSISQSFQNKRNSRYVVSLRTDGQFNINLIDDGEIIKEGLLEPLKVCKNCLKKINYQGYSRHPRRIQSEIFGNFDLGQYFELVKTTSLNPGFFKNDKTAPLNIYNPNFRNRSKKIREKKNYTCEECDTDLSQYPNLCHTHHIDGNKSNDNPYNLKVLCVGCHSLQPKHERLKFSPEFKEYSRLKRIGRI